MNEETTLWRDWAAWLREKGLAELVSTMMEGLAPLLEMGAQLLYLGQPLLSLAIPNRTLNALAHLLEVPEARLRFQDWLKEE